MNITNYNVLFHALLYMSATDDYQLQRLVAQANTQAGGDCGSCQRINTTNAMGNTATTTRQHVIPKGWGGPWVLRKDLEGIGDLAEPEPL